MPRPGKHRRNTAAQEAGFLVPQDRLAGRRNMNDLALDRGRHQLRERDAQRFRQLRQDHGRRNRLAALDLGDHGTADAGGLGQLFEREVVLLPEMTDLFGEDRKLRIVGRIESAQTGGSFAGNARSFSGFRGLEQSSPDDDPIWATGFYGP